jgi:hypothetical protein
VYTKINILPRISSKGKEVECFNQYRCKSCRFLNPENDYRNTRFIAKKLIKIYHNSWRSSVFAYLNSLGIIVIEKLVKEHERNIWKRNMKVNVFGGDVIIELLIY